MKPVIFVKNGTGLWSCLISQALAHFQSELQRLGPIGYCAPPTPIHTKDFVCYECRVRIQEVGRSNKTFQTCRNRLRQRQRLQRLRRRHRRRKVGHESSKQTTEHAILIPDLLTFRRINRFFMFALFGGKSRTFRLRPIRLMFEKVTFCRKWSPPSRP